MLVHFCFWLNASQLWMLAVVPVDMANLLQAYQLVGARCFQCHLWLVDSEGKKQNPQPARLPNMLLCAGHKHARQHSRL